jgi:ribonuclease HI|tara:strand:+ start:412 stop:801 length:390 start_codon:yes stop_codon:yes gene_type:complete
MKPRIFVDGGTRGMVIALSDPQKNRNIMKRRRGATTNNDLEYLAIIFGIEYINKKYPKIPVTLYSDSRLAVKQINGEYRINGGNLLKLNNQVQNKLTRYITITWIRRSVNLAGIYLEKKKNYLSRDKSQ